ncbi:hypothetical protein [Streptomyces sp. GbtcB6]|uniref:hypothetical protein n=1 Tax=Streptomyces sp. GbtcB6 TaxID=2824751 RepID=UPI001C2F9E02|nr:hypothetical protein [Streptomyces sp. GbtcB6]
MGGPAPRGGCHLPVETTDFVDRRDEQAAGRELLAKARLVTCTTPGEADPREGRFWLDRALEAGPGPAAGRARALRGSALLAGSPDDLTRGLRRAREARAHHETAVARGPVPGRHRSLHGLDLVELARRTAEGHVERILGEPGFSNRSQIAARVTARR